MDVFTVYLFFFFYFILLFFRYVASSSVFIDLHYSVFIYIYIFVCFVTTVVCRPNHRRKNVTPRTDFLRFYSLLHSRQKMSLVSFFSGFIFFGSLSVTSWFAGSTEDESEEASDGQKGRKLHEK